MLLRFLFQCLSGRQKNQYLVEKGGVKGGAVPVVTCPHISQVSFDDDIDGSRRLPHGAQNTRVPREVVIREDGEVSVE